MRTLSLRAAPWLLGLVLLAGCGGSGDDPAPAPAADGAGVAGAPAGDGGGSDKAGDCKALVGITFCMHYELTGAITATGVLAGTGTDGTGRDLASCAEWAKGAPGGDDDQPHLYLPQGGPYEQGDKFGGLTGDIIEHYHGPGTYGKKDLSGQGSPSGVITPSSQTGFVLVGPSTGTATVNADGSGSVELIDMGTGQYGHPETLSAKVTWTCHDG